MCARCVHSSAVCAPAGGLREKRLLAVHAEIVDEGRDLAVRVDGHMENLVHHEVVVRALADDAEVVDERLLGTDSAGEAVLRYAGPLILIAGDGPVPETP